MHHSSDDENVPTAITAPRRAHHGDLALPAELPADGTVRPHRSFSAALTYRLASVEKSAAPGGSADRDWYRYVLKNDNSTIEGFRRGSRAHVSEYAEQYAEQLNSRTVLGPSPWSTRNKNPLRSK